MDSDKYQVINFCNFEILFAFTIIIILFIHMYFSFDFDLVIHVIYNVHFIYNVHCSFIYLFLLFIHFIIMT